MHDDKPLSKLLATWQHTDDSSAEFSSAVWSRIRSSEERSPRSTWLRPSFAAALWLVGISGFAGGAAAYAYDSSTRSDRMASAHVAQIDPLQLALHSNHRH